MRPDPLTLIEKYYDKNSISYEILVAHSRLVSEKAISIARAYDGDYYPNLDLIQESSMLHDIGVYLTDLAMMDCHGAEPYIRHGILGREILESFGLFKHGLICERHIGAGITANDIRDNNLPLPARDMMPLTMEEKIVCLADNFYSKNPKCLDQEKTIDQMRNRMKKHGMIHVERLNNLLETFGYKVD